MLRKFQYSLSSLLWFTLCCALVISSILMYRRMEKAERENVTLRKDAGYLAVDDENLFHAVSVKTYEPLTWRWRVFLPKGKKLMVDVVADDEIPANGMPPKKSTSHSLDKAGGERILNAALRQDKDGQWFLYLTFRNNKLGFAKGIFFDNGSFSESTFSIPIPESVMKEITRNGVITGYSIFGEKGTESLKTDETIMLLRHRMGKKNNNGGYVLSTEPSPGIMIWLEEAK